MIRSILELTPFLLTPPVPDLVIVTGADSSHRKSLGQFLQSVLRHAAAWRVVVYDLGLRDSERDGIRAEFPRAELRTFDFAKYPPHLDMRMNAGEYAWKPVIIADLMDEVKSPVCWMDAGNVLTGDLRWIRKVVNAIGLYSPRSAGTLQDWTHPKTLEFLGVPSQLLSCRNLNGACVAVDHRDVSARDLVHRWRECALIKDCIAPSGSDRSNHRQDQALLSVLAHQRGLTERMPSRYYGFRTHQDVE